MNFFQQGIPLGRWFGITVVIHWTFLIFVAWQLFGDGYHPGIDFQINAMAMALLFGTVLVHEFGHALSCIAVGGQALHIVLWPLGGIAFVQPPPRPGAWLISTVCGPLVNAILWPLFWYLSYHWGLTQPGGLTMWAMTTVGIKFYAGIAFYLMWQINRVLLLFNLIPAYPMDGGRILQELLWFAVGYGRSLQIAGMVGTVAGGAFVVLGLGLQKITIPYVDFTLGGQPQPMLVVIGVLCAMQSFGIYRRSHEIQTWRKN